MSENNVGWKNLGRGGRLEFVGRGCLTEFGVGEKPYQLENDNFRYPLAREGV